jgi:hypothetical protein
MICVDCGCSELDPCDDETPGGLIVPCTWVITDEEEGGPQCSVCAAFDEEEEIPDE